MVKKKYKDTRPKEFIYETFKWKINWFDKAGPNIDAYGTTDTDLKIINIYSDQLPMEVTQELLGHEIEHVLHENVESTKTPDKSDMQNEELHIRLTSPRRFTLYRENPHLIEFIFGWHND